MVVVEKLVVVLECLIVGDEDDAGVGVRFVCEAVSAAGGVVLWCFCGVFSFLWVILYVVVRSGAPRSLECRCRRCVPAPAMCCGCVYLRHLIYKG